MENKFKIGEPVRNNRTIAYKYECTVLKDDEFYAFACADTKELALSRAIEIANGERYKEALDRLIEFHPTGSIGARHLMFGNSATLERISEFVWNKHRWVIADASDTDWFVFFFIDGEEQWNNRHTSKKAAKAFCDIEIVKFLNSKDSLNYEALNPTTP